MNEVTSIEQKMCLTLYHSAFSQMCEVFGQIMKDDEGGALWQYWENNGKSWVLNELC
ncbi:MAG: hypothetical protein NPIRA02_24250 [Nitrospirales bacterium]|nr:MAG: hypothetical protein NPIRA02_24250 [Nitrospirales bacterium]